MIRALDLRASPQTPIRRTPVYRVKHTIVTYPTRTQLSTAAPTRAEAASHRLAAAPTPLRLTCSDLSAYATALPASVPSDIQATWCFFFR